MKQAVRHPATTIVALMVIQTMANIFLPAYIAGAFSLITFTLTLVIILSDERSRAFKLGVMQGEMKMLETMLEGFAKIHREIKEEEKKQKEEEEKYDPRLDDSDRSDELRESREYHPDRV